jgi:hypothetical protein
LPQGGFATLGCDMEPRCGSSRTPELQAVGASSQNHDSSLAAKPGQG